VSHLWVLNQNVPTNADGIILRTNTYDAEGRHLGWGYDHLADGVLEGVGTLTYDAEGLLLEQHDDWDALTPGDWNSTTTRWEYDERGLPTRSELEAVSPFGDRTCGVREYTYDDRRDLVVEENVSCVTGLVFIRMDGHVGRPAPADRVGVGSDRRAPPGPRRRSLVVDVRRAREPHLGGAPAVRAVAQDHDLDLGVPMSAALLALAACTGEPPARRPPPPPPADTDTDADTTRTRTRTVSHRLRPSRCTCRWSSRAGTRTRSSRGASTPGRTSWGT
jgi:hypothetical protein